MILLFLPLLFSVINTQKANDWECGTDKVPLNKELSEMFMNTCHFAVKAHANLCCKVHDYCYDNHLSLSVSQEECDNAFCRCLQDGADKTKNDKCNLVLGGACAIAQATGRLSFANSVPEDHYSEFAHFADHKPLGLNMKNLLDSCSYNKRIVAHCHNTAYVCLLSEHDRDKRELMTEEEWEKFVTNSWEDCKATMFDCLRSVIETSDNDQCTAIAKIMQNEVDRYRSIHRENPVNEASIPQVYRIISTRLLAKCQNSINHLLVCYRTFEHCAQTNPVDKLDRMHSAVRRIHINCHRVLSTCVEKATREDKTEGCMEARALAISRIRDKEFTPPNLLTRLGIKAVDATVKGFQVAKQGVQDGWKWAKEGVASLADRIWNWG